MQRFFLVFLILCFNVILGVTEIEAARLGGGRSIGRQMPNYSRPAAPPTAPNYAPQRTPAPAPAAPIPTAAPRNRWLGPLTGFVAGGLLASLFFGQGFNGLQFFDILIFIAIAAGIFLLFRSMRNRNQGTYSPEQSFAAAGEVDIERFSTTHDFNSHTMGSGNAQPLDAAHLSWFNEENFLQNARTYYLRLQAAWDAGRMTEIAEYVTPELYRELSQQRATLGQNFTEVLQLNVEFLGLAKEGDTIFAGVRYSGMIREQQDAPPHPFKETWHIQRSLSEQNANWYIAGIQQN